MPPGKQVCRDFQSGRCRYGERCKFLHPTPKQSNPSPFGFGAQKTQQQISNTNPFGFGVQKNNPTREGGDFGYRTPHFKPGENKWTRPSSLSNNQTQSVEHQCTDPVSCKRFIVAELEKEKPQWKLSCFGHCRNGPCEITGDTSSEELRALAYYDAKNGKSLQYIIEREKSLIKSKQAEFQNLVTEPQSFAAASFQNPLATVTTSSPQIKSNTSTPTVGVFSQFGSSMNTGTGTAPNYSFGQSSPFQNSQPPSSNIFNNSAFNKSGSFGTQFIQRPVQNTFSFGSANFNNVASLTTNTNPIPTSASPFTVKNVFDSPIDFTFNEPNRTAGGVEQQSNISMQLNGITPAENNNVETGIWTKAQWNIGEIPEEAPPDIYIH